MGEAAFVGMSKVLVAQGSKDITTQSQCLSRLTDKNHRHFKATNNQVQPSSFSKSLSFPSPPRQNLTAVSSQTQTPPVQGLGVESDGGLHDSSSIRAYLEQLEHNSMQELTAEAQRVRIYIRNQLDYRMYHEH